MADAAGRRVIFHPVLSTPFKRSAEKSKGNRAGYFVLTPGFKRARSPGEAHERVPQGEGDKSRHCCLVKKACGATGDGEDYARRYFLSKRPKARRSFWAACAARVTLPWCTRISCARYTLSNCSITWALACFKEAPWACRDGGGRGIERCSGSMMSASVITRACRRTFSSSRMFPGQ